MAPELILDVDPKRWAEWLENGRRLDRIAARQMLGAAIAAVLIGLGVGTYFLMGG
ncbi:MAG: hypothetical protein NTZ56_22520 [Acidobacteria bacterium]|nr:hypothetical protein [Acidobacteriota bacterium]